MVTRDWKSMTPETRKMHVRGPESTEAHWRRDPGPESLRFVTKSTCGEPPARPLPPTDAAPPPCATPRAPAKAGHAPLPHETGPAGGDTTIVTETDTVGVATVVAVRVTLVVPETVAGGV